MTSITICLSLLFRNRFMTLLLLFVIYSIIIIIFDEIMLYQSSSCIIPKLKIIPIAMAFRFTTITTTTINHSIIKKYHYHCHDHIIKSTMPQSSCLRRFGNIDKCYRTPFYRPATFHLFSSSSSSSTTPVIDHNDDIQNNRNNNDHQYDELSSSSSPNVISSTELQTDLSSSSMTTIMTKDQSQQQNNIQQQNNNNHNNIPLLLAEGLFAINKPLNWTSSNIVSYIRKMLEHDTRRRGIIPGKVGSKSKRVIKVGHGGTLDPLATGVLVIGVGNGTKILSNYLSGNKIYKATGQLGFETTTLDMEGNTTKTSSYEHITSDMIQTVIQEHFLGAIQQIPPLFSAIKKNGKAYYKIARKLEKEQQNNENSTSLDDNNIIIESREVMIYNISCYDINLPYFTIEVECGGGTYIRSLIRDIAYQLNTVATTTKLERIQQGPFHINDSLSKDEWSGNVTPIYNAIQYYNDNNILSETNEE